MERGPRSHLPGSRPSDPDNEALERLLLTASDRDAHLGALRALVDATVLLLGRLDTPNGRPGRLSLPGPTYPLYPFFTSRGLTIPFVRRLPEPRPALAERWVPCRQLLEAAVRHNMNLVFNPATKLAGRLSVSAASDLLAGRTPEPVWPV